MEDVKIPRLMNYVSWYANENEIYELRKWWDDFNKVEAEKPWWEIEIENDNDDWLFNEYFTRGEKRVNEEEDISEQKRRRLDGDEVYGLRRWQELFDDDSEKRWIENDTDDWMWDDRIDDIFGQIGGGEEEEKEEDFYVIEPVKQVHSKKFKTSAQSYKVRFNNTNNDLDVTQEYTRTQRIFERLLDDVTDGMNENDQVRFVLQSTQLNNPVSLPFMPLSRLTPERVFSQVERVVQSNQSFALDDSVIVNITRVEVPVGSARKRNIPILRDYLKNKRSVYVVQNKDNLCLARALVVAIAKKRDDADYKRMIDSTKQNFQTKRAKDLHHEAHVPVGPCGIPEVKLFQKHLKRYEINIVSSEHGDSIIYPSEPTDIDDDKRIYLYYHHNHYDVIFSMPGFCAHVYYCHKCRKPYNSTLKHLCSDMCRGCRFQGEYSVLEWTECTECNRMFKSQQCYNRHKERIGNGKSVCEGIKKCLECGKTLRVRNNRFEEHLCNKVKCKICEATYDIHGEDHRCYIQKSEKPKDDENGYNKLLFFDYECRQEDGIHVPNLCVVQDESGKENVFRGENTNDEFCKWVFSKEHSGCVFLAHNFQGYDGYFIQNFLNKECIKYDHIMRGGKIISLTVPMFKIKFMDSLNFIPMALANFPKTFGIVELCKGYFPHLFNRKENQNYVGPIPPEPFYHPDGMKPKAREAFQTWHKEKRESDYVFDFEKEILEYCRSDVDILRQCCLQFREMFRDTTGIDPFERCTTIASACMQVYCTNFLKENTIAIFSPVHQLKRKQSVIALKWLSYVSEKEGVRIQQVRNGGEKRVDQYFLDGYDSNTHTAYEFHGCFFHGCEKCYAADTVHPYGKTMGDLRELTRKKVAYLKREGYTVIEKWECELKKELEENEEMRTYFDQCEYVDPLHPRDAFYGGRMNATKLFHKCEDGEKIRYADFTSLYPWCNKMTETVVGYPEIITENFDDLSKYFGLIKCTVLPPRGLFHPVLPYHVPGKLTFPLCKTCADTFCQECNHTDEERAIQGTWCLNELMKAVEKGYEIVKIHEIWHWEKTSDELFKEYVNTFLKIKQEASGFPKNCVTEEQKQAYIDEYYEHEGIRLDREKIKFNPGLRALAKLMLNSFWGKFAQRPNLCKSEMITDVARYFELLFSDDYEVHDARFVNENMIEVQYKYVDEFESAEGKGNVVIAAFTTAYARLKLYDQLDVLQERAYYYDTDSIVYISKQNDVDLPLGNYLGDLTDELDGEYITTFMSGGPKNYAYCTNTGKTETKIRGFTLNHSTKFKINPSTVRALVYLHAKCKTEAKISVDIPFKITRDLKRKNILTKRMKKDYRVVYDKRVVVDNYNTLPYGF